MKKWSKLELFNFESEIAELFNSGKIKSPVHLSEGNETELIEIFDHVQEQDWVLCSWRSHYHCLLKGVNTHELRAAIIAGRSIALCFPENRVISSAIVGGQIPIAIGIALGEKLKGSNSHVWCFIGDMTAETGIANSAVKFSLNYNLPITFIVEDNKLSVLSDTREVWKLTKPSFQSSEFSNVQRYEYVSKYPHAGAGQRVQF